MGGGNWRHATAMAALLVVLIAACSSNGDVAELPPDTQAAPTVAEPTTTTAPTSSTSTTLSETAVAEAEIKRLLTDFWTGSFDGEGQDGGPEYLTGLLEARFSELVATAEAQGNRLGNSQESVIEVTSVEVDLESGTGEATSCGGSAVLETDIETGEIVVDADPTFLFTSDWVLELTAEGWKIAEWYASATEPEPTLCEFTNP